MWIERRPSIIPKFSATHTSILSHFKWMGQPPPGLVINECLADALSLDSWLWCLFRFILMTCLNHVLNFMCVSNPIHFKASTAMFRTVEACCWPMAVELGPTNTPVPPVVGWPCPAAEPHHTAVCQISHTWNLGVLLTLFWSQIQNTAYRLLWRKLTPSQPGPVNSSIACLFKQNWTL